MRKLLLSAITLFLFSASSMMFQVSCQKNALANPTSANKIFYVKSGNVAGKFELWVANIDGSNQQKINFTIPYGYTGVDEMILSGDGKKMVLSLRSSGNSSDIFTCNLDSSNLAKIIGNKEDNVYYSDIDSK